MFGTSSLAVERVRLSHRRTRYASPLLIEVTRMTARKGERERRANVNLTLECDVALHCSRKSTTDGEPQPGAVGGSGETAIQLHKGLENRFLLVPRYSGASVFYVNGYGFVGGGGVESDPSAFRRKLHRVRDKVDHDLAQLVWIRSREEVALWRLAFVDHVLGPSERAHDGVEICDQRAHGNVDDLELDFSRLEAREIQNVGDRKSTRLNSSHDSISYAVFCL